MCWALLAHLTYLLWGATKGEKHLLISVKPSQLTSSSLLYFKFRPYFSELSMDRYFLWSDFSVFS